MITQAGAELVAVSYVAAHIDAGLAPFSWYKAHVLRGAEEHDLPADYIRTLEQVEAITDPDQYRHAREISIYR